MFLNINDSTNYLFYSLNMFIKLLNLLKYLKKFNNFTF